MSFDVRGARAVPPTGRWAAGVAAAAVLAALAGCAGAPGGSAPGGPPGVVHGHITGVGGPRGAADEDLPGTVVVTVAGRRVASQSVAEGGEFRFSLPPGHYRLAVTGLGAACQPADVTVTGSSDQAIALVCQRK